MITEDPVPPVGSGERLARFITQSGQFRADGTLREGAFSPPPNRRLSVTRLRDTTLDEIWNLGRSVANARNRTFYGFGEVAATVVANAGLAIELTPLPENRNHVDIVGWPTNKEDVKSVAQELAAAAVFRKSPGG